MNGLGLIGLIALTLPTPAIAQAYQCQAPALLPEAPKISRPADEPRRVRPVTGYVLALSWSPEYCRTRQDSRADRTQCGGLPTDGGIGDFGFILHGLWPETDGPDYPQWCRITTVPKAVVRGNLCMIPSPRLIAHEWAKHGSCMTRRPETYFRISRTLFDAVRYPPMERLSRAPLTVGELRTAFADVNPGLEPQMLVIDTNERGWLEEVKICLGKDFAPRNCPKFSRGADDDAAVRIWRGL